MVSTGHRMTAGPAETKPGEPCPLALVTYKKQVWQIVIRFYGRNQQGALWEQQRWSGRASLWRQDLG
jgi:hypothetical protein